LTASRDEARAVALAIRRKEVFEKKKKET